MAFSIGTSTTLADFFTQLRTFAAANAAFANLGTEVINSTHTVHKLSKGGVFWSFEERLTRTAGSLTFHFARCRMTYTEPTAMTGFDQTTPTGQPRFTCFGTYGAISPFISHAFYTDGTAVHAVLEPFAGVFTHISFGSIQKISTWTGGEYLTAGSFQNSFNNEYVYSTVLDNQFPYPDLNGIGHIPDPTGAAGFNLLCTGFIRYEQTGSQNEDDFSPLLSNTAGEPDKINDQNSRLAIGRSFVDRSIFGQVLSKAPNQENLRTPLLPMYVRIRDYTRNSPASLDAYFVGGIIPIVRVVNIQNLTAKDIINTDWQIYPVCQKGDNSAVAPGSGFIGLAFQRVP